MKKKVFLKTLSIVMILSLAFTSSVYAVETIDNVLESDEIEEENEESLLMDAEDFDAFVNESVDLNFPLTWTSSDESVATVVDGTITAVGKGEASVMAECEGRRAICSVVVEGITVTFDGNGGTVMGSPVQEYSKGETYGEMPTAARAGYAFAGWYSGKNGGIKITSTRSLLSLSDHTLYARWESAETEQLVCTGQDGDTFYYDATLISKNRIESPIFKKDFADMGVFSVTYGPNPKAAKKVASVNSKRGYLTSKLKDKDVLRDCTITIKKAGATYVVSVHVDKVSLAKPYIIYGEDPVNPVVVGTNLHISSYSSKENNKVEVKRKAFVSEDGVVTALMGGKKRAKIPYTVLICGTYVTKYVYIIDPKWKVSYEKKTVNGQKVAKTISVVSGDPKKDKVDLSKWIINGCPSKTQWSVQTLTGEATISQSGVLQGVKRGSVVVKAVINGTRTLTREVVIR